MQRLSEYRVMWVMVFFDLPTNTNKEKRAYTIFRKDLMKDGFGSVEKRWGNFLN